MRIYVDSSVVLRHILNRDPALGAATSSSDLVGSSDLLVIECMRVLQRERMAGHLDDHQYAETVLVLEAILERLTLIEIGPAVKRRAAGPFPTVIGTLDAIHLASALLWQETEPGTDLRILTQDRQLALCARSLGLRVS
ncbi:MAG: type II toxin-antitoxin system VapC family toxin [Spirochaetia bacterium]